MFTVVVRARLALRDRIGTKFNMVEAAGVEPKPFRCRTFANIRVKRLNVRDYSCAQF